MTVRRYLPVAAALLALAGCGGRDNSPEGQCERQSYDDPAVHQLEIARLANTANSFDLQGAYAAARKQAIYRCLNTRGLAPPGGVEPVQPSY
jgi:hypothetical protein